jgi:hypothetical protein
MQAVLAVRLLVKTAIRPMEVLPIPVWVVPRSQAEQMLLVMGLTLLAAKVRYWAVIQERTIMVVLAAAVILVVLVVDTTRTQQWLAAGVVHLIIIQQLYSPLF